MMSLIRASVTVYRDITARVVLVNEINRTRFPSLLDGLRICPLGRCGKNNYRRPRLAGVVVAVPEVGSVGGLPGVSPGKTTTVTVTMAEVDPPGAGAMRV